MLNGRTILIAEAIKTQTDGFGQKLEGIIAIACDYIQDKPESRMDFGTRNPMILAIQDAIFKRLGIRTDIITDHGLAAIMPFYSNRSHIFLPDWIHGHLSIRDQNRVLENLKTPRGTVNLEKAKVGGLFSEYTHPVYLNLWVLVNHLEMTPAEITAVLLHELGHGFKACYYADRTDRTNQTLATIARHIQDSEKGDLDYIYVELQKIKASTTKEEVDRLVNGNRVVAGAQWFKTITDVVREQTLDKTYNQTSFEAEADSFASRFGYGRPVVTALDKLSAGSAEKSTGVYILTQVSDALGLMSGIAMVVVAAGAGAILPALLFSLTTFLIVYSSREDVRDMTYDHLKDRYQRLRNDAVNQLKDAKASKEQAKATLQAIEDLDIIIKQTRIVRTLPFWVASFFYSGSRAASKSISDQKLMEGLAANDLFIESAKLKTLA